MGTPTVVICIDGLDPEYVDASDTPHLRELGRRGFWKTGRCVMPSVTNVNNVSITTGRYAEAHGISSNYRLVRETGQEVYMESPDYIQAETVFERARSVGKRSVLVTSKDKLRALLGNGATIAVSSEQPPGWVVDAVGPPPEIYSLDVNGWVVRAARYIMAANPADVVYVSTTDYAMHTFAPGEPQAREHMTLLDDAIGGLVEDHPEAAVLVTADHGMSAKTRMLDLKGLLAEHGISASAVPVIKDKYVVHHSNLGGCIYVHIWAGELTEALKVLRDTPGVDLALARDEAASRFRLPPDRIGDVVVTGTGDVVFGDPNEVQMPPRLRSHGSEHERAVPIIGYNGEFQGFEFEENRDIGRYLLERVLGQD